MRLEDKVAVITGGAGGIARRAIRLARPRAAVAAVEARRDVIVRAVVVVRVAAVAEAVAGLGCIEGG